MAATTEDDEWAISEDDVHSQSFNPEAVLRAEFPGFTFCDCEIICYR